MNYPWADFCNRCSTWHQHTFDQFGVRVITQPTIEPITLEDARVHLRVDPDEDSPPSHPDDALIMNLLRAAREWCEGDLGLSLATQTLELRRSGFPVYGYMSNLLELPFGPVGSIASVKYLDGDNVEQTVDPLTYSLSAYTVPQRLYLASGSWPSAIALPEAVRIRYTAGYSMPGESPQDTEPLPFSLRAMILLVLGHLYENRENVASGSANDTLPHEIPMGAKALGDRYRVRLGMA